MPCVVIVRKREDFSDALVLYETLQNDHPAPQVLRSIYDRLVPGRRLLFDALAIAEPAHVSEIRCD